MLNISHQPKPNLYYATGFVTHFIFFFPSNLLLREATVRPAGSGGGGGASGARARTRVTDGVSGSGVNGRPSAPDGPVRTASCSTSWFVSMISLEAETPPLALAFFLDLVGFDFEFDLGLSSDFSRSSVGFFGDRPIVYSGWWSDSTQRRRPRCTPRSPAISSFG